MSFCNNNTVVKKTPLGPELTLEKKCVIVFHMIREASASGMIWVQLECAMKNIADVLTKFLSGTRL